MQKIMKNKGITLVALVVTIVIMLILAGVTLNIALGENGLFKMTQQVAEKYKTAQSEEESTMQGISDELQGLIGKGKDDETPGVITGEGTKDKPYLIESIEDLVEFSNKVNSGITYENQVVKLAVNLDFKSEDSYANDKNKMEELTSGTGFASIGNDQKQFKGTFDGQNRTISNLYIKVAENYKGLFGYVGSKGTIKNLTISNANINCEARNIGILAGYVNEGKVENIKISNGKVTGNREVGGIAGHCINNAKISSCFNYSDVTANGLKNDSENQYYANVGGIIGQCTNTTIINSHNTGKIYSGKGAQIGGITGSANGTSLIDSCSNDGKVGELINDDYVRLVGGIAGSAYGDNTTITKCFNTGIINGRICIGGIVGELGWNSTAYLEYCYNIGAVTTIQGYAGGICYVNTTTENSETKSRYVKNCYNIGTIRSTTENDDRIREYSRNRSRKQNDSIKLLLFKRNLYRWNKWTRYRWNSSKTTRRNDNRSICRFT